MQVRSKEERGKRQDLEIDLEMSGIDDVAEQRSQSTTQEPNEVKDDDGDGLSFSAARSIFFVLALTGAAFLNVWPHLKLMRKCDKLLKSTHRLLASKS